MEVKINKEIRDYTESMFFGLSLRQFIFSLLAVGVAVVLYFGLKNIVGTETVSWMCILGASPFAAMGFIKYHGMTTEKLVWTWIKSEFLNAKKLPFKQTNYYYEALKPYIKSKEQECMTTHD
ncbi:PrgI family protein [Paludicola sp. MB14-C6]|uniref:PrgI family protein n=1 Tax=Paludihabitans sp. MB14-C6 TaxID=3070656 RepID=UPI0027DE5D63|nr:PrgI family protein [Paludicola sp. MB14-C6]WMJ22899.1 PrgI family protein [Paludicola sp. MB14-C6]